MKRFILLATALYCLRSDGVYLTFQGMSQGDVDSMLSQQGLSCQYISADTYNTDIANQQAALSAARQAQQAALTPYVTELATTTAAIAVLGNGYVGANAITQVNYNAKMIRIIQLRQLLGLQ